MRHDALIIEDEPVLARNMQVFFERSGYAARTADCAELGLTLIDASKPDIILLDHHLPGMSGMEMLAHVKERHPDLKVVMLTGRGSIEMAIEAMRLGASDFLTKPISLGKLRVVVDQIVGHERLPSESQDPILAGLDAAAERRSGLFNRVRHDLRRLLDS